MCRICWKKCPRSYFLKNMMVGICWNSSINLWKKPYVIVTQSSATRWNLSVNMLVTVFTPMRTVTTNCTMHLVGCSYNNNVSEMWYPKLMILAKLRWSSQARNSNTCPFNFQKIEKQICPLPISGCSGSFQKVFWSSRMFFYGYKKDVAMFGGEETHGRCMDEVLWIWD